MKKQSVISTFWWNLDQKLSLKPVKGELGSYLLYLFLSENLFISKPRTSLLKQGYYVYCGSARNGLLQRINRHLRRDKRIWWHIDQITASSRAVGVLWSSKLAECELSWKLRDMELTEPVKGFGSSDCSKSCYSHFFVLETPDQFDWRLL
ncbi:MAG: DUF123 domain-containing protein [Candidatus Odinarchaeota archaeon]